VNLPPLPEGYYLANFLTVLEDAEDRCDDLLVPPEREILGRFRTLTRPAQRLYVRMLTRRGPWFRADALVYDEIGDPGPAIEELASQGFCTTQAELPDLLPLLRRGDLLQALAEAGRPAPKGARREALVRALLEDLPGEALRAILGERLRPVRPLHDALWTRLFLMFFGNFEQDLATFVVADRGLVRYEAYPVEPGLRAFESRADVDFLLSLHDLRARLEQGADGEDLEVLSAAVLAMEARPGVRLQRRFQSLLNGLGRAWERRQEPQRALECYARSGRPPARERRIRILARSGDPERACLLALEAAQAPGDEGEARFTRAFLERQRRQLPWVEDWLRAHPEPPLADPLEVTAEAHPQGVEQAALEAARAEGWDGFFAENRLWRACFGLALWEVLFAAVPGAFQHRFQNAPLDLGGDDFYLRRRPQIDARLAALRSRPDPASELLAVAERKRGLANAFLDWRGFDAGHLAEALPRVGAEVLCAVLEVLARQPRAFASGFPDLFLYRPGSLDWKLWEVKGPGDTLRPEQEGWLRRFTAWGCEARMVRVRYPGH